MYISELVYSNIVIIIIIISYILGNGNTVVILNIWGNSKYLTETVSLDKIQL